jgi:hypothetical protein
VVDGYLLEVDALEAADVDGRGGIAFRVGALAERMIPQFEQNRCWMTCLLNVYVLKLDSGVVMRSLARGTNHSSEPLRSHIEQLHASALSIVPSTSNATRPQ